MANSERLGGENSLKAKLRELQERLLSVCGQLPSSAIELRRALIRILNQAVRAEALLTSVSDVARLVTIHESTRFKSEGGKVFALIGGPKDFKRLESLPEPHGRKERLVRDDGCVVHFTIAVAERAGGLELLAYDFEVYRPGPNLQWFLRFDLNERGHENDHNGLRSHLHPSDDNIQVPSAVMTPTESLALLLYGARKTRDVDRK